METNLLDRVLDTYLAGKVAVTMTLQNKTRISGRIKAFDSYVILMDNQRQDIVYRHAVSSLTKQVRNDQQRQPVVNRTVPAKPKPHPAKEAHKSRPIPAPPQPQKAPAETINSSMKEGLLKWMQEHNTSR